MAAAKKFIGAFVADLICRCPIAALGVSAAAADQAVMEAATLCQ
jgi:hypothetical protein